MDSLSLTAVVDEQLATRTPEPTVADPLRPSTADTTISSGRRSSRFWPSMSWPSTTARAKPPSRCWRAR